uniref:Uncharacterized protein n=1 Tax=Arundo donax TaxID=35708 RepID=A0A0A9BBP5_ARUDO
MATSEGISRILIVSFKISFLSSPKGRASHCMLEK